MTHVVRLQHIAALPGSLNSYLCNHSRSTTTPKTFRTTGAPWRALVAGLFGQFNLIVVHLIHVRLPQQHLA